MTERIDHIPRLPLRKPHAHKGDFGRVLIIGGSRGMVGAPALAANAAFRCGAGLVRIAVPEGIWQTVAGLAPCATVIPLVEDAQGKISHGAWADILTAVEQHDVVAIGPGMAQSSDLQQVLSQVITATKVPLVIDADGLNNLAAMGAHGPTLRRQIVLTPHPGEMKRLWSAWQRVGLPEDRQPQAEILATQCGAVLVLKGAGTVVTDGSKTYINQTGNPGMATGGSGDVLTGCIASIMGQGLDSLDAGVLGVYIHGKAGDLAAHEKTQVSLMASDLVEFLPAAWADLGA